MDFGKNTHFGNHCFANYGFTAIDVAEIRIDNHVMFGTNVQLMTPIHPLDPVLRKEGGRQALRSSLRTTSGLALERSFCQA